MDAQPFLDLIAKHQWVGLAALVIGLVVRLLKEDTSFPPFAIPARWRPVLALGLGVVSGVLQAASTGTPWRDAVLGGLVSAFLAIAGHDTIVNSLRDGQDVPIPAALARKAPPRPVSVEPPTPPDPSVRGH
jgi:hypothetical protein